MRQYKLRRGTNMAAAPIMHDVTPAASAFLPKVTQGTNQVMIPGVEGVRYLD